MKIFTALCACSVTLVTPAVFAGQIDMEQQQSGEEKSMGVNRTPDVEEKTLQSPFLGRSEGLFQSREIYSKNITRFTKWVDLWRRYNLKSQKVTEPELPKNVRCIGLMRARCNRQAWEGFIKDMAGPPSEAMLAKVNRYMNRSPYIVDPVNWGVPDYWATPQEFFFKDGDCEDYAISKYVTLLRLGVKPAQMRLVILQDENLRAAHAVLAVLVDGKQYILDNQIDQVLTHDRILHYRPVYSINQDGWWLHQGSVQRRS